MSEWDVLGAKQGWKLKPTSRMTSIQTIQKLHFDIMGVVFSHYADEETIQHPLETLLLVCRDWSNAALGHRSIWGQFRIYIGHGSSCRIWRARLPRRLARCGPRSPLDIDIRMSPGDPQPPQYSSFYHRGWSPTTSCALWSLGTGSCPCYTAAKEFAKKSLELLGGLDGSRCARWRSLTLHLNSDESREVALTLTYPTPNLIYLELENIWIEPCYEKITVLPSTPMVRRITILDCILPSLPSFQNVLEATVGWTQRRPSYSNLSRFCEANHLQKLSLRTAFGYSIPLPQLSQLCVLQIAGQYIPTDLYRCHLPQLSSLTVEIRGHEHDDFWLVKLFDSPGITPQTLKQLTLKWDNLRPQGDRASFLVLPVRNFLNQARNLEFVASSGAMLSVIIRVLWSSRGSGSHGELAPDDMSTMLRGASLVNLNGEDKIDVQGGETSKFFVDLAKRWDCVDPGKEDHDFFFMLLADDLFRELIERHNT